MRLNLTKYRQVLFFGFVFPIISYYLAQFINYLIPNTIWLETLSPVGAYIFIFFLFNKFFWHWPIISLFSMTPDLRGRWKGEIISSFKVNGENVKKKVVIEIEQTFNSIDITAYYRESSFSHSSTATFKEIGKRIYLYYTYENDPLIMAITGDMRNHKGTTKFLINGKSLSGVYWNDLGNRGDIQIKFVSKKILNKL